MTILEYRKYNLFSNGGNMLKKIREKLKLRERIIHMIKIITCIIPKNKKLWIFGAWKGMLYSDNTRYLFEYLNSIDTGYQFVWISKDKKVIDIVRNKGYTAYYYGSLSGIWSVIRAKVAFYTEGIYDISPIVNKKTKIIQLWHGMGVKAVGMESG